MIPDFKMMFSMMEVEIIIRPIVINIDTILLK